MIDLEKVSHDIADLLGLRAVFPPHAGELLRLAARRLPARMSGPALGEKQLLQPGDPELTDQLQDILKNVKVPAKQQQKPKPPKGVLKKSGTKAKKEEVHKQQFLVFAQDCKTSQEHPLNIFDSQEAAEDECKQWQERHRGWYQGFNNYTLFVRGCFLNKSGQGGLTSDKLFVLSADWA